VTTFVNEAASPHLADFIDAVGKLVSAILNRHLGGLARQIPTIDVCDA
jgi:hypothetical protein